MVLFALTDKPATLWQWLHRSLLWTALGCGLMAGAWCLGQSAAEPEYFSGGIKVFLLLVAQMALTVVLVCGALPGFRALYRQDRHTAPRWLTRAALAWWEFLWLILFGCLALGVTLVLLLPLFILSSGSASFW